jgi:DMSO/TMAO reductase YedYZ molybdopterin-dependent catalytic subunit
MRESARLALTAVACLLIVVACSEVSPKATPEVESGATTPPLTPLEDLGVTGTPIEVDVDSYRLVVDGLVEQPLSLGYDDLLAYPAVTQVLRLDCPGFFVDYAEWTGPLVSSILNEAGVKPEASEVQFYDGGKYPYSARLSLEEALSDDTFLAYQVYGQTLPEEHGYPVRLVVGSKLGSSWVKWLFRIEVK